MPSGLSLGQGNAASFSSRNSCCWWALHHCDVVTCANYSNASQEAADSTFYGQQLQKKTKEEEAVDTTDGGEGVASGGGGGVASLQQRLSALQDMSEEERGVALRDKRLSTLVSLPSHRLSLQTSAIWLHHYDVTSSNFGSTYTKSTKWLFKLMSLVECWMLIIFTAYTHKWFVIYKKL